MLGVALKRVSFVFWTVALYNLVFYVSRVLTGTIPLVIG